jgi:hypothetical protein
MALPTPIAVALATVTEPVRGPSSGVVNGALSIQAGVLGAAHEKREPSDRVTGIAPAVWPT